MNLRMKRVQQLPHPHPPNMTLNDGSWKSPIFCVPTKTTQTEAYAAVIARTSRGPNMRKHGQHRMSAHAKIAPPVTPRLTPCPLMKTIGSIGPNTASPPPKAHAPRTKAGLLFGLVNGRIFLSGPFGAGRGPSRSLSSSGLRSKCLSGKMRKGSYFFDTLVSHCCIYS
jgi:hypothetical protein